MIENAHSTPGLKNRAMQSSSVTFVFCFTPRNKIQNTYFSGTCIISKKLQLDHKDMDNSFSR